MEISVENLFVDVGAKSGKHLMHFAEFEWGGINLFLLFGLSV